MTARVSMIVALLLAPFASCDRPAPGVAVGPRLQADFLNGPADLPNVFRGDSILLFVWADHATNLAIAINAPLGGVSEVRRCGGAQRPSLRPVQTVGEMQDVMRQLRLLREVNIDVYSPVPPGFSGFMDLCQVSPMAHGEGNLTSTDNDRIVSGSGADAFGFRADGLVDVVSGGRARVVGESQQLIRPGGSCCETLVSKVDLVH